MTGDSCHKKYMTLTLLQRCNLPLQCLTLTVNMHRWRQNVMIKTLWCQQWRFSTSIPTRPLICSDDVFVQLGACNDFVNGYNRLKLLVNKTLNILFYSKNGYYSCTMFCSETMLPSLPPQAGQPKKQLTECACARALMLSFCTVKSSCFGKKKLTQMIEVILFMQVQNCMHTIHLISYRYSRTWKIYDV